MEIYFSAIKGFMKQVPSQDYVVFFIHPHDICDQV